MISPSSFGDRRCHLAGQAPSNLPFEEQARYLTSITFLRADHAL